MIKQFFGLVLTSLIFFSPVYPSDILSSSSISPGCQLGKDGREKCPESWDAYDYFPVSICKVSKDAQKLTCPIVRIFPRRPSKLHSVEVNFRPLSEDKARPLSVGLCVFSQHGASPYCPPSAITYLTGTKADLDGRKAKSIVRDYDWGDYMYIEVKNGKNNGVSLEDVVIGYRATWLLDAKNK